MCSPRRYELRELVEWFLRVMRKGPEHGGGRVVMDTKFNRLPMLKSKINEYLPSFPINFMTLDKLERVSLGTMNKSFVRFNKLPLSVFLKIIYKLSI